MVSGAIIVGIAAFDSGRLAGENAILSGDSTFAMDWRHLSAFRARYRVITVLRTPSPAEGAMSCGMRRR
jgi:hypothetical protein